MKQIVLLGILLFSFGVCAEDPYGEWKKLEKEVTFTPYPITGIDSLLNAYNIKNDTIAPEVEVKLPAYDKAVYHLKWGIINVGYGVLENEQTSNGILNNYAKAMTSGLVAHFLKVRDFVWSYGDKKTFTPYYFQQSMYEKGLEDKPYIREKWTLYDHDKGLAHDWTGKEQKETEIASFSHNYLSLLYAIRNSEIVVGDTLKLPCFVHGKTYDIKNYVHKKEKIKVPAGTFECYKIQPFLVGKGHGFNEKDKMYLWIDVKPPHQMIFAKADARLGKVRARLVHYEYYEDE